MPTFTSLFALDALLDGLICCVATALFDTELGSETRLIACCGAGAELLICCVATAGVAATLAGLVEALTGDAVATDAVATGVDATGTDATGTDATGVVATDVVATDVVATDVVATDVVATGAVGTDAVAEIVGDTVGLPATTVLVVDWLVDTGVGALNAKVVAPDINCSFDNAKVVATSPPTSTFAFFPNQIPELLIRNTCPFACRLPKICIGLVSSKFLIKTAEVTSGCLKTRLAAGPTLKLLQLKIARSLLCSTVKTGT